MAKHLVIVESPAKAKTINKFIGKDYDVKASVGHIRDLPKSELGVDETTFEPVYEVLEGKEKVVSELRAAAKKADLVYIASDPDREGEAIGWHVVNVLGKDASKVRRILFHEITKNAVRKALDDPRELDMNKVNAQQARRILDRLVGYKLSPLLWDKVKRGLSAGRVQSVALKMIVDRENEIRAFQPQEYWTFAAKLEAKSPPQFIAKLAKVDGKKTEVPDEEQARTIEAAINAGDFIVRSVQRREKKRSPGAPFITSRLQQEAHRRFKYPVRRTMQIAQGLYEGKELGKAGHVGLITYMRTDSVRVSDEALGEVRDYIRDRFGSDILPESANVYRTKKNANVQDAHEAIRPTSLEFEPEKIREFLTREEYNLYKMIFDRFVASQMKPALFDVTDVEIEIAPKQGGAPIDRSLLFAASGEVLKFAGFLSVFVESQQEDEDENEEKDSKALPAMNEGDRLRLVEKVDAKQNFTQPPARFSEATLVKALEENGIGRPSTYGAIIQTIQTRDYSYKEDGKLVPTELGIVVTRLLREAFNELIDEGYTARLEEDLDRIEEGNVDWKKTLADFSLKFEKDLSSAGEKMPQVKGEGLPTDQVCEKCSHGMVIKFGRYGEFLACSNYPECKNTKEMAKGDAAANEGEEVTCDKCGKEMQLKRSKFGQFWACTGYPDCKSTKDPKLMNVKEPEEPQPPCEKCGKEMILKSGRYGPFYSCSGYPDCSNIRRLGGKGKSQSEPTGVTCPKCGEGEIVMRMSRRGPFYSCNRYPKCEYTLNKRPIAKACPQCSAPILLEHETKREGPIEMCADKECGYRGPRQVTEG